MNTKYILLLFLSCFFACEESLENIENDVWRVVERRNSTWKENDVENQMKIFHPQFRRWSYNEEKLFTKNSFADNWQSTQDRNIKIHEIKVNRKELQFFNNNKLAAAHYSILETLEWVGEDYDSADFSISTGELIEEIYTISDYYVKSNSDWLYIGGSVNGPFNETKEN